MIIKAYTINAFAKTDKGGNPAGVVVGADRLTESQMKKIAERIGFSETAFVMASESADFKVRFFTPTDEVDLCGHATIGTFAVLLGTGQIEPGQYTQETKAGILEVEVHEDGTILMEQGRPEFYAVIDRAQIAESLNISVDDLAEELPVQIVSTGLKDIMVPIRSLAILEDIKPDFEAVTEVSRKYDAVGYHLFTLETKHGATAHCRNLAPLYGIPEESATGTSNGALACFLYREGRVGKEDMRSLAFEQGYTMDLPSEIKASLDYDKDGTLKVMVGGKALDLKTIELELGE